MPFTPPTGPAMPFLLGFDPEERVEALPTQASAEPVRPLALNEIAQGSLDDAFPIQRHLTPTVGFASYRPLDYSSIGRRTFLVESSDGSATAEAIRQGTLTEVSMGTRVEVPEIATLIPAVRQPAVPVHPATEPARPTLRDIVDDFLNATFPPIRRHFSVPDGPSLRTHLDYQSVARRTLLVEPLLEGTLSEYDREARVDAEASPMVVSSTQPTANLTITQDTAPGVITPPLEPQSPSGNGTGGDITIRAGHVGHPVGRVFYLTTAPEYVGPFPAERPDFRTFPRVQEVSGEVGWGQLHAREYRFLEISWVGSTDLYWELEAHMTDRKRGYRRDPDPLLRCLRQKVSLRTRAR